MILRHSRVHIRKAPTVATLAAVLVAMVACQEQSPTAVDDGRLPESPLTVEVNIPWSDFGSSWQVLEGFSSASGLSAPVLAHTYGGTLESRVLVRHGSFPVTARVIDETGATVVDPDITYAGGRLVLAFDTAASVVPGPVSLRLTDLQESWDSRSATWTLAVDSIGEQRAWTEAGAGPTSLIGLATWDPAVSDSVTFFVDSTTMARWEDVTDMSRGARIEATTDGVLLRVVRARLRVLMRPTLDPDTLVEDTVRLLNRTFVYDPPPSPAVGVRVGGAPASRTVMNVAVPPLTGPPELCAAVTCPYTVGSGQVSYAALTLTTRETEGAFMPQDSLRVDVRAVLSPATLPKSPLGSSESGGLGTPIAAAAFGPAGSVTVDVPITNFVRTLLGGPTVDGWPPPSTLALMSAFEPSSLAFASFFGPTEPGEPVLRMILTVGNPQVLP